jgi:hypothetical protein
MKTLYLAGALALAFSAATAASAQDWNRQTVVATTSNAAANQLLVYDTAGHLVQTVATGGKGGVSGNAGGIAIAHDWLAAVNFGSQDVSIFERTRSGFRLRQTIHTVSAPVSVAFGHEHLYVLGTTKVESHPIWDSGVASGADGVAGLVIADGSAAQVGVIDRQLVLTEKSNAIETVNLSHDGAVVGEAALVSNIPQNVNTPFGLATRGNDAYVTIAHANETSLVRNDTVLTVTGSGTQNSPCWLALDGPFLFSSNSPSMSVSRYAVYGEKVVQDAAVVATFSGDPTDIAYRSGLAAVIDGSGAISHLSIFHVDEDGNFAVQAVVTINNPANGVAILRPDFE